MPAPRDRFTATADNYARYRPDYPRVVVEHAVAYAGLTEESRVVDVGCGTGISSRLFAAAGYDVVGVDPNEAMLAKAREEGGGIEYRRGDASATGLPDASAQLITAAQALHWFEMDATLREWERVLVAAGACAAFWNYRIQEGWQNEYEALLMQYSTDYPAITKAIDGGDDHSRFVKANARCRDIEEHSFPHQQTLDLEGLVGRANSSSYVVHGVADRGGFDGALRELFAKHQREGAVMFRYRTYLLLFRLN